MMSIEKGNELALDRLRERAMMLKEPG